MGIGLPARSAIVCDLMFTFPFLLAVLGLGKLVTECLRSVEMIYLTLAFITTPVFYMSGTIWPLQAMPDWVRMIASALPSTWATNAMAGLNQMGLPFSDVLMDIVMMLILGVIYTVIGVFIGMLEMANCVILAICLTAGAGIGINI